jgi:hypothetical protein
VVQQGAVPRLVAGSLADNARAAGTLAYALALLGAWSPLPPPPLLQQLLDQLCQGAGINLYASP